MDARRRLVAMDEERAIVRTYTDPAVDLVVHTSTDIGRKVRRRATILEPRWPDHDIAHDRVRRE